MIIELQKEGSIVIDKKDIAELKEVTKVTFYEIFWKLTFAFTWLGAISPHCSSSTKQNDCCEMEGVRCERGGVRRDSLHWGGVVEIICKYWPLLTLLKVWPKFAVVNAFWSYLLSKYLVQVIDGEWREARQMSGIPVAFSYFKVTTPSSSPSSSSIGSYLTDWVVQCVNMSYNVAKFPVTKRGALLAGKPDSVNTEVSFHQMFTGCYSHWQADFFPVGVSHHCWIMSSSRIFISMLTSSSATSYISFFLQVCLSSRDGSHVD